MDKLDQAQAAIKKGERVRLLMEMTTETLGLKENCKFEEFAKALRDTDKDFQEATILLGQILHKTHPIKPNEEGGVSDSN